MNPCDDEVCGATKLLPDEFVAVERVVTGRDWPGVTVTCDREPHSGNSHDGPLIFDGEVHGAHYWRTSP